MSYIHNNKQTPILKDPKTWLFLGLGATATALIGTLVWKHKKRKFREIQKKLYEKPLTELTSDHINSLIGRIDPALKEKWLGSPLNSLFGLIYIVKKHHNACAVLPAALESAVLTSIVGTQFFGRISIMWDCTNAAHTLKYPKTLTSDIRGCRNRKGVRFIIILLTLFVMPKSCIAKKGADGHANLLVWDLHQNVIARYEPNGAGAQGSNWFDTDAMDVALANELPAKLAAPNLIYEPPARSCVRLGIQVLETREAVEMQLNRAGDPGGWCAAWSIWYADLRLTYPDIKSTDLQQKAIAYIQKSPQAFVTYIRNYADFILSKKRQSVNMFAGDAGAALFADISETRNPTAINGALSTMASFIWAWGGKPFAKTNLNDLTKLQFQKDMLDVFRK